MATYKFRVLLDNSDNEEIFRDIEVSGRHNFEDFYRIIIKAFFFQGDQMASFYCSNNEWDKGDEIALFDMGDDLSNEPLHLMTESNIKSFIKAENQKFILVYDFLKMWCFLIELIEIKTIEIDKPEIVLSIGISPREESREINFDIPFDGDDLGNDFDDIFSEHNDEEDFEGFENIDDYDI
ncbi:MAG: hypothetical protein AB8B74_02705 [Crocinitomicaceae bacterium]